MKTRILIVDDNANFRVELKEYLTRNKLELEIFEASTGEIGVAKASFIKPHIVLMDISLPKSSGFEATKCIKEDNPDCDVIILTMFNVQIFKNAAERINVREFIGKSEICERLVPVIKKCLDDRKTASSKK